MYTLLITVEISSILSSSSSPQTVSLMSNYMLFILAFDNRNLNRIYLNYVHNL